MDGWLKINVLN